MKLTKLKRLRKAIEETSEGLTDEAAAYVPELFPMWKSGRDYVIGERVQWQGVLYKVRQAHTSQESWTPDLTPALYEVVSIEDGTREHPISYAPGMALEQGKYYREAGIEYICVRDTGIPVYNPLAQLVGLYVEVME